MSGFPDSGPGRVLERMVRALNDRDLNAYVDCYAEDYRSVQPVHPDWSYTGKAHLRWNWTGIFENVQEFRADLLRYTITGDTVWTEWYWSGVQPDDSPLTVAGVIIMEIEDEKIASARIYMESVAGMPLSYNQGREGRPSRMDA
jgi:ketosteroid isomerase-like protein